MSITIKEALQRASFLLKDAGFAEPRREAVALLAACLEKPLVYLYAHDGETIGSEASTNYFQCILRRAQGEPYAYLTGEREFMAVPFFVTPAVLIPRPETEFLVQVVAKELAGVSTPRILEIGVGSGAVAITLAQLLPDAQITAVDLSAAALAVASRNTERHHLEHRIRLLCGDLYAPVSGEAFDAVVSNPPYIPASEIPCLPRDVKNYEPHLALDGGPDGLSLYRRLTTELHILAQTPTLIAFEIGAGQAQAVIRLLQAANYKNTRQVPDLAGIPRILLAQKPTAVVNGALKGPTSKR